MAAEQERAWQHPWIRAILETRWNAELWPAAKAALARVLKIRAAVARGGWFN